MNWWISIGISRFSRQKLLAYVSTIQTSDLIPKQYLLSHIIFLSAWIWTWETTNDMLFSMYTYSKIISISNVINVSTIESMQKSNILHMVCIVFLICMDPQSRRRSANDIHFFNTYLLKNCFYFKCHWCRELLSPCRKVTSGILLALYFLSAWICNNRDVANDIQFFNTNLFKNHFYFNCH